MILFCLIQIICVIFCLFVILWLKYVFYVFLLKNYLNYMIYFSLILIYLFCNDFYLLIFIFLCALFFYYPIFYLIFLFSLFTQYLFLIYCYLPPNKLHEYLVYILKHHYHGMYKLFFHYYHLDITKYDEVFNYVNWLSHAIYQLLQYYLKSYSIYYPN